MISKTWKTTAAAMLILAGLLQGCNQDEGPFTNEIPLVPGDTIHFAADIQPIFDRACVACHGASHPKLNLNSCCSYEQLTSTGFQAPYVYVAKPDESILYGYLKGSPQMMPPSGSLPQSDLDKVLLWIHQGALNN